MPTKAKGGAEAPEIVITSAEVVNVSSPEEYGAHLREKGWPEATIERVVGSACSHSVVVRDVYDMDKDGILADLRAAGFYVTAVAKTDDEDQGRWMVLAGVNRPGASRLEVYRETWGVVWAEPIGRPANIHVSLNDLYEGDDRDAHNAAWAVETFDWLAGLLRDDRGPGPLAGKYATTLQVAVELCNYALEQELDLEVEGRIGMARDALATELHELGLPYVGDDVENAA